MAHLETKFGGLDTSELRKALVAKHVVRDAVIPGADSVTGDGHSSSGVIGAKFGKPRPGLKEVLGEAFK
ncbi:MAG: hypothetical protein RLZZ283_177 [Candidatus Parcubacteria bacterium]|jgi:hypothetical protein